MSPALASSCGNNLERALEFARWSGTAPLPITALRRQLYACGLQLYAYACAPPLVDISDVPGRGGGATQPSRAWPPARLSGQRAAGRAGRRPARQHRRASRLLPLLSRAREGSGPRQCRLPLPLLPCRSCEELSCGSAQATRSAGCASQVRDLNLLAFLVKVSLKKIKCN